MKQPICQFWKGRTHIKDHVQADATRQWVDQEPVDLVINNEAGLVVHHMNINFLSCGAACWSGSGNGMWVVRICGAPEPYHFEVAGADHLIKTIGFFASPIWHLAPVACAESLPSTFNHYPTGRLLCDTTDMEPPSPEKWKNSESPGAVFQVRSCIWYSCKASQVHTLRRGVKTLKSIPHVQELHCQVNSAITCPIPCWRALARTAVGPGHRSAW